MILRKTYILKSNTEWDREINEAALDFMVHTGVKPNVLLANDVTYAFIDFVASNVGLANIKRSPDQDEDDHITDERISLSAFQGQGYELEFCIDESLGEYEFSLIYDDDVDGGEPIPAEDNVMDLETQAVNVKKVS